MVVAVVVVVEMVVSFIKKGEAYFCINVGHGWVKTPNTIMYGLLNHQIFGPVLWRLQNHPNVIV